MTAEKWVKQGAVLSVVLDPLRCIWNARCAITGAVCCWLVLLVVSTFSGGFTLPECLGIPFWGWEVLLWCSVRYSYGCPLLPLGLVRYKGLFWEISLHLPLLSSTYCSPAVPLLQLSFQSSFQLTREIMRISLDWGCHLCFLLL